MYYKQLDDFPEFTVQIEPGKWISVNHKKNWRQLPGATSTTRRVLSLACPRGYRLTAVSHCELSAGAKLIKERSE